MTLRHVRPDYRECSDWLACWLPVELEILAASKCPYQVDTDTIDPDKGYCGAFAGPRQVWCPEHEAQLADWYPDQYRERVPDRDTTGVRAIVEALDPSRCPGSGVPTWPLDVHETTCPDCGVVVSTTMLDGGPVTDDHPHHPQEPPPTCMGSGRPARDHGWQPCPVCGVVVEVRATSWGDVVIDTHPEDPSCG